MRGSESQGQLNKGAWVRGSLPVETPAPPGQGQEGPFLCWAPAGLRVQLLPVSASLSPLTKEGALPGRSLFVGGTYSLQLPTFELPWSTCQIQSQGQPETQQAKAGWVGGPRVQRPHVCRFFVQVFFFPLF